MSSSAGPVCLATRRSSTPTEAGSGTNATLSDGDNNYTATAQDTYGRQAQSTVSVNLPSSASYTYDLNGNLLSDGSKNYAYDDENELLSVWQTNVWRSDFVYDGLMRRRIRREYAWNGSSWQETNEVRDLYDQNLVVQERDGNNVPVVTYTRGIDLSSTLDGAGGIGGLLARTENAMLLSPGTASSAHAYYHCDGNGNVTAMVNTNGQIVARYEYDPFGNIIAMSGPLADANTYRFSSKEWHRNSGLVYYGYRFYSPNLQRWLNADPLGMEGGYNLFNFVMNGPANFVDLYGLCEFIQDAFNNFIDNFTKSLHHIPEEPQYWPPPDDPKQPRTDTPRREFLKEALQGFWKMGLGTGENLGLGKGPGNHGNAFAFQGLGFRYSPNIRPRLEFRLQLVPKVDVRHPKDSSLKCNFSITLPYY